MTQQQADRMLKLAGFLKTLPRHKFDMREYVQDGEPSTIPDFGCDTAACALGWCPYVFPDEWVWTEQKLFLIATGDCDDYHVGQFFGIHVLQVDVLFYSGIDRTPAEEAALLEACVVDYDIEDEPPKQGGVV